MRTSTIVYFAYGFRLNYYLTKRSTEFVNNT